MLALTIRTDNPEAELGLFDNQTKLSYKTWHAHRELAETIHSRIKELLDGQTKSLQDIEGIVVYQGPGSFTGLRIGITVANAFAYALSIPIIAAGGDNWAADGITKLQNGESAEIALPEYGAPVHITLPKK